MKREQISDVIGGIDERHIAEARRFDPAAGRSPERIEGMKAKHIIPLALAAALLLSLSIAAYATYSAIGTPEAAEKVAQEQLEVWKEMGILNPDFQVAGKASRVIEIDARDGGAYWYGRLFPHQYGVAWSPGDGCRYGCFLYVDTLSGKLTSAFLDARPAEGREPLDVRTVESEPGNPETLCFYDNFEDIVPADMTVDRFCTLLADYWGFGGYTVSSTVDSFYGERWPAVDGSTRLLDLPSYETNYYLTVFFEGDQEGAPMYIQLNSFVGYADISLGAQHAVG